MGLLVLLPDAVDDRREQRLRVNHVACRVLLRSLSGLSVVLFKELTEQLKILLAGIF